MALTSAPDGEIDTEEKNQDGRRSRFIVVLNVQNLIRDI